MPRRTGSKNSGHNTLRLVEPGISYRHGDGELVSAMEHIDRITLLSLDHFAKTRYNPSIREQLPGYRRLDGTVTPVPDPLPNPNATHLPLPDKRRHLSTDELISRIGHASSLDGYHPPPGLPSGPDRLVA